MTISAEQGDGSFYCQWFEKNGVLQAGDFYPQQLRKAETSNNRIGIA
jgi:uncharacterized protein YodC (DUF2158 family)